MKTKPVVLVTGAAGGLGSALCEGLLAEGFAIGALDMNPEALERLHVQTGHSKDLLPLVCDITNITDCESAISAAIARWGRIDGLVNNAGITHIERFAHSGLAPVRKVMEVNFFGSVNMTHAALEALVSSKGTITVISSVAGFAPLLGRTGYAASKHALHGFFESLRAELSDKGVDILMVCPSFIMTGIGQPASGANGEIRQKKTIGKVATPAEVAGQIIRSMQRKDRLLVTGTTGKLSWWLKKWTPGYYERAMTKRLQAEV